MNSPTESLPFAYAGLSQHPGHWPPDGRVVFLPWGSYQLEDAAERIFPAFAAIDAMFLQDTSVVELIIKKDGDPVLERVTPKVVSMPRILFLHDPRRVYQGRQVDNIRKPLRQDCAIKRFCELSTMMFREMNYGSLADYHGPIIPTPAMVRIESERRSISRVLEHRYGTNTPEQCQ